MKAIDQNEKCFGWREKQKNYKTTAREDKYFLFFSGNGYDKEEC